VRNLSDESFNENIGVGAGGADVGSNPTPRTILRVITKSDGRLQFARRNLVVCDTASALDVCSTAR